VAGRIEASGRVGDVPNPDVSEVSVIGPTNVTVPVDEIASIGTPSDGAVQNGGSVLFTGEAFRALVRSEYVAARNPVSKALRPRKMPMLDAAPDVVDAWVFGLYARVLGRLPDPAGRVAFSASLRTGSNPRAMLETLLNSEEAISQEVSAPTDLDEAFVVGAYLVVLGRGPDPAGSAGHLALLRGHGSHQQMLDGLMSSSEAQRLMRYPPPPVSRARLVAEALQRILYGSHEPDEAVTQSFAAAYSRGAGTRQLARAMLRHDRRLRGVIRSLFVTRNLARLIEIEASARGAQLEAVVNRAWEWRVARATWKRNDGIDARLADLKAAASRKAQP
jgi:hypothetical protein